MPKTCRNFARVIHVAVFSLMIAAATGCGPKVDIDTLVEQIVVQSEAQRASILTEEGNFSDYRVYRENETTNVVLEFKLKPGITLTDSSAVKSELVRMLVQERTDLHPGLSAGLTLTYLYLDSEDKEIIRQLVSADDLPAAK